MRHSHARALQLFEPRREAPKRVEAPPPIRERHAAEPQHPSAIALRDASARLAGAARHAYVLVHLPHAAELGPETRERAERRRWGLDDLEAHHHALARCASALLADLLRGAS